MLGLATQVGGLGKILQEVEDKSPSLYSCLHCSAWYYTLWAQGDNWLKKNMSELQIVPKDPPVHLFFSPPLPTPAQHPISAALQHQVGTPQGRGALVFVVTSNSLR